ncbi:MAG TPA: Flp family type IVb pilin [Polyangiaceae bacterium]|nr:Flp family type IVb pilin [Polyangiaceae bacterium]
MERFKKLYRCATGGSSVLRDERGLTTVEYVIILVLLAVVAITVWTNFGEAVRGKVTDSTNKITDLPIEDKGTGQ